MRDARATVFGRFTTPPRGRAWIGMRALAFGLCVPVTAWAQAPAARHPDTTTGITAGQGSDDASASGITAEQERHLTHAQIVRLRQLHRAPPGLAGTAQQNRELGQIGHQLLKGTPKQPAGSTMSTGGGLAP